MAFHEDVRAVFEKYGAADFFYAGVDLDGDDTKLCGFRVGRWPAVPERSYSNRHRVQRMTGIIEGLKIELNSDNIKLERVSPNEEG